MGILYRSESKAESDKVMTMSYTCSALRDFASVGFCKGEFVLFFITFGKYIGIGGDQKVMRDAVSIPRDIFFTAGLLQYAEITHISCLFSRLIF